MARCAAGCSFLLAAGCAAPEPAPTPERTPAVDLDPDPDVLRIALVAEAARVQYLDDAPTEVWAYRDAGDPDAEPSVPGPPIRARVGQTLVVELTNELPSATTIHWHGVRLSAAQDGTTASQVAVAPGERYTYTFVVPDAGTFWYHPHVRADEQIERGLYGALVVEGPEDPRVDVDRVLVLDDVKLEASGALSDTTDALDLMLGRQGNVLLVDGRRRPTLEVSAGTRERWRFINAANGRYFALRMAGRPWQVIAGDGGLLPEPRSLDTLLVTPGERYDVLVDFTGPTAADVTLETIHHDRGHDIPDPGPLVLADVRLIAGNATESVGAISGVAVASLPIDAQTPERELVLTEDDRVATDPVFFINGRAFPDHEHIEVSRGALEVWALRNDTEMDHPFHVHGTFFQILDEAGVPATALGRKDTVNVPRESTLRIAVPFDSPGEWMMHCHILEHAERGMMGMLHVRP